MDNSFRDFVSLFGGPIDNSAFNGSWLATSFALRKRQFHGIKGFIANLKENNLKLNNLKFEIINNVEFNACATCKGNEDWLLYFLGLYGIIEDFCINISLNNVFLFVNTAEKKCKKIKDEDLYKHYNLFRNVDNKGKIMFGRFVKHLDDSKFFYLQYETLVSLTHAYVFLHEIGHLVKGHSFIKNFNNATWIEYEKNKNTNIGYWKILQSIELDADRYAVERLAHLIISFPDLFFFGDYSLKNERLFYFFYSIILFYSISNLISQDLTETEFQSHPGPSLRLYYSLRNSLTFYEILGLPLKFIISIFFQCLEDINNFFLTAGIPTIDFNTDIFFSILKGKYELDYFMQEMTKEHFKYGLDERFLRVGHRVKLHNLENNNLE